MLADARNSGVAIVVGACLALISAYVLVHRSASMAIGLASVPLLVWLLMRPSRGLAVGLLLTLAVPYWWSLGGRHAYQVAALLAAFSVVSARRLRLTVVDVAIGTYSLIFVLGWLLQYDHAATWHIVLDQLIPLGFYVGARTVPRHRLPAFMTLTLFAGTLGALTVIYEFVHGSPLFIDPALYFWNPAGGLFRPGGVFGSPPGAATVMMFVLLFGLAGLRSLRGRARAFGIVCLGICALALVLTFTRAPMIGAGVGLLVFLWLVRSPLLRPRRLLVVGIVIWLAVVLVLPSLQSNGVFQQGVARGGTLTAREGYWRLALPIAFASPHNFIFGIGTGVLETPALSVSAPLPYAVAATPQVFETSLHNQYVTTLVEQGVIGLAALVLALVAPFVSAFRAARENADACYAAVAATLVGMAIVLFIDTELLHTPSLILLLVSAGFAAQAGDRAQSVGAESSEVATQRGRAG